MATSIEKTGVVKSTNDFGFKFEGSDDYYDYSKQSEVERTTKGAQVFVRVSPKADGKWWVNSLEHMSPGWSQPTNGYAPTGESDGRQRSIVRQSSLKAAIEFYGMVRHEPDVCGKGSDHVLQLAEKFAEWVNRDD